MSNDTIDKLVDIYVKWGEKNNIKDPTSADEVILRDDINDEQRKWLESFIENWNQVISDHHKQSENKIVNKSKKDFWEDKVEGFIPPKLPDYNDPTLSFLIKFFPNIKASARPFGFFCILY